MNFTPSTKLPTKRVLSQRFDSLQEAEATIPWERLSYEQGHAGKKTDPSPRPGRQQRSPSAAGAGPVATILPQGKCDSMPCLCWFVSGCVQLRRLLWLHDVLEPRDT